MNNSIFTSIGIGITFIILGSVLNYLYKTKRKKAIRLLVLSISLLILMTAVPMLLINGQRKNILNFVLEGNLWFSLVLLGYLGALIALLFEKKIKVYLSLIFYSIAFFSTWIAVFKFIPDSVINNEKSIGLLWIFIFIVIPMATYLLYLSILVSYRKKFNVLLKPEVSGTQLIENFKIRIHPFLYIFWGGLAALGCGVIYGALRLSPDLSSSNRLLMSLLGVFMALFSVSWLINKTIILNEKILLVPITTGNKALFCRKAKMNISEVDSIFIATGGFLHSLAEKIHDSSLQKNLNRYRAPSTFPFLYVKNKDTSSNLFSVAYYSEKKIMELANQLNLRNIKTEIHI